MPIKDGVGMHWNGMLEVVAVNNATTLGGAVIRSGVAKVVDIYSISPPSFSIPSYILAIAIVAVILVILYLLYRSGARKPKH
jgi:hypothetical protein